MTGVIPVAGDFYVGERNVFERGVLRLTEHGDTVIGVAHGKIGDRVVLSVEGTFELSAVIIGKYISEVDVIQIDVNAKVNRLTRKIGAVINLADKVGKTSGR